MALGFPVISLFPTMNTSQKPFSFGIFLLQFIVAFLILLLLSGYVWFLQSQYDLIKIGYARAFFHSLIIFGAEFSYDCAKKILFLDPLKFIPFAKNFGKSLLHTGVIVVLVMATAIFLTFGYTLIGQLIYVCAVAWGQFAINSIMKTIEAGSK
jgi:hypothetical protein